MSQIMSTPESADPDVHTPGTPPPPPPPPQRRPSQSSHDSSTFRASTPQPPRAYSATTGQKRRRFPVSCYECRRRKLKCDREQPCQRCRSSRRDCVYAMPSEAPAAKLAKSARYGSSAGDADEPAAAAAPPQARQKSDTPTIPHMFEQRMYDSARYELPPPQISADHPHQLPQMLFAAHSAPPVLNHDHQHHRHQHQHQREQHQHQHQHQQHQVPISQLLSAPGPRDMATEYHPSASTPGPMDQHKSKNRWFVRGKNARIRCFGRSHISSLLTQVKYTCVRPLSRHV